MLPSSPSCLLIRIKCIFIAITCLLVVLCHSTANREITPVGEHAPKPFEDAETEMAEPEAAEQNLEEEDGKGGEHDVDKSEGGAETETETVEQEDADERLTDIV